MNLLSGFHRHHIIPRYQGGTDAPENLVLLHPIDHAIAHLVRFKLYGNVRDAWAANWLLKIEDPEVYSRFSAEREAAIKDRRSKDKDFDLHMRRVRSLATKDRVEGYQRKAGKEFKRKFASDASYAEIISQNRKRANAASIEVRRSIAAEKVELVRKMRQSGASYKQIQIQTGYSLGAISNIINRKSMVGVGGSDA